MPLEDHLKPNSPAAADGPCASPGLPEGHYYSPTVDPNEASVQRAMDAEAHPIASLASFGIDEQEVLRWYEIIAKHYDRTTFPEQPAPGRRYYYANPNFPLADALALLGFMAQKRPRRYIEVGAGFSSCAAIDINEQYLDGQVQMTFLDPCPETVFELLGDGSPYRDRVMSLRLQDASLEWFTELAAGDILFIDSSHVGKTGSDVLDCFFRILPELRSGVLVHLHNIFPPSSIPGNGLSRNAGIGMRPTSCVPFSKAMPRSACCTSRTGCTNAGATCSRAGRRCA